MNKTAPRGLRQDFTSDKTRVTLFEEDDFLSKIGKVHLKMSHDDERLSRNLAAAAAAVNLEVLSFREKFHLLPKIHEIEVFFS